MQIRTGHQSDNTMNYKVLFSLCFIALSISIFPEIPDRRTNNTDTIWKSDQVVILGDTTIDRTKINYTAAHFEPYISFCDFKAKSQFKGIKVPINFRSNITARRYKTRIIETYHSKGVNFGGHYCFVFWGCGSPCKSSAIVDLQTGKVYDGPTAELGYEYRKDSYMLIVNPPDSSGFYDDCIYCHPQIWIWNEQMKRFIERKPYER